MALSEARCREPASKPEGLSLATTTRNKPRGGRISSWAAKRYTLQKSHVNIKRTHIRASSNTHSESTIRSVRYESRKVLATSSTRTQSENRKRLNRRHREGIEPPSWSPTSCTAVHAVDRVLPLLRRCSDRSSSTASASCLARGPGELLLMPR
jgi:hypothetical protein